MRFVARGARIWGHQMHFVAREARSWARTTREGVVHQGELSQVHLIAGRAVMLKRVVSLGRQ